MTVIVCQDCDEIIDFADGNKVDVLYGKCSECREAQQELKVNTSIAL